MLTLGSMEVIAVNLPDGLYVCQECGCIRGTTMEPGWNDNALGPWTSTCLCEGNACKKCDKGKVRRIGSNYYCAGERGERGYWTHVPHVMAFGPRLCADCGGRREVDYRLVSNGPKPFWSTTTSASASRRSSRGRRIRRLPRAQSRRAAGSRRNACGK